MPNRARQTSGFSPHANVIVVSASAARQRCTCAGRAEVSSMTASTGRRTTGILKGSILANAAHRCVCLCIVGAGRARCRRVRPHRAKGPNGADHALLGARHHVQQQVLVRSTRARHGSRCTCLAIESVGALLAGRATLPILIVASLTLVACLLLRLVVVGPDTTLVLHVASDRAKCPSAANSAILFTCHKEHGVILSCPRRTWHWRRGARRAVFSWFA